MADTLEEVHEELLGWADTVGVKINSIRPMRISGRGFGSKSSTGLLIALSCLSEDMTASSWHLPAQFCPGIGLSVI